MHPQKKLFIALNALGGMAVLGSYVLGVSGGGDTSGIWGGVPDSWRPIYTVNMFLAAAGYFPMTAWWLVATDPERLRIGERFGFGVVIACYAAVLIGSALWLPLTNLYLESPSGVVWVAIVGVLASVGLGAAGVLFSLLRAQPRENTGLWRAAVVGSLPFVFQTAVLDFLVWTWFFPR